MHSRSRYSLNKNHSSDWRDIVFAHRLKLFIAVLVLVIALLGWQYNKARNELKTANNPAEAAQKITEDVVAEVGKVVVLPTDEQPTVANIGDIEKLRDQPFFSRAQNGDKVLIYKKAQKAIIYRPSTKQVVEMAGYDAGQAPKAD